MNNKFDSLNYYKILNLSPTSSDGEIRQSYRELAKFWHPDHNTSPNALDMFQKISVAYDVLKNPQQRLKYTLLSIIYSEKDFPDMNALSILKNMHGQEDVNMRAFHLIEITGKGIGHKSIDKVYYCSQYEAESVVGQITKHNWLHGFWGITAFFATISALIKNINNIASKRENLVLHLHNALAYADENRPTEAATAATLALLYASKEEKIYITKFLESLNTSPLTVKKWNIAKLRKIQFIYPLMAIALFCALVVCFSLVSGRDRFKNALSVKEMVVFNNGQKIVSDIAVARIFDIPVDVYDKEKLYHTTKQTNAMHGADSSFDIYKKVEKGTTVRITGYTVDKKWYQVMFDNGDKAFIESIYLEQGIGNTIPLWSKIYKEK
jgi:curved DNA-binding protein CbpA/uncharacterized pyridoxamine 5'-phosphate oxidase family protein